MDPHEHPPGAPQHKHKPISSGVRPVARWEHKQSLRNGSVNLCKSHSWDCLYGAITRWGVGHDRPRQQQQKHRIDPRQQPDDVESRAGNTASDPSFNLPGNRGDCGVRPYRMKPSSPSPVTTGHARDKVFTPGTNITSTAITRTICQTDDRNIKLRWGAATVCLACHRAQGGEIPGE